MKDIFNKFRGIWVVIALISLVAYNVYESHIFQYIVIGLVLIELLVEIIYFIIYKEIKRLGKTITGHVAYIIFGMICVMFIFLIFVLIFFY